MEVKSQLSFSIETEQKTLMPTKTELLKACEALEDRIKGFTLSDICYQAGYPTTVLGDLSKEVVEELVERSQLSQSDSHEPFVEKFDSYSAYYRFVSNWEHIRSKVKRPRRKANETISQIGKFPHIMS